MPHQVSTYKNLITVRIDGRAVAQELYQDTYNALNQQSAATLVILDVTFTTELDQQVKSVLYRALQHHLVTRVGISGISSQIKHDVNDLLYVLRRIRRVSVRETETDLRVEFGLTAPEADRKMSGMLTYLKAQPCPDAKPAESSQPPAPVGMLSYLKNKQAR